MKYRIRIADKEHDVELISRAANALKFSIAGTVYDVAVEPHPQSTNQAQRETQNASTAGVSHPVQRTAVSRQSSAGEVRAPMPGVVVQVLVELGKTVAVGDAVIIVEAMKMENTINCEKSGKITSILVAPKQQVNGGDVLLVIE